MPLKVIPSVRYRQIVMLGALVTLFASIWRTELHGERLQLGAELRKLGYETVPLRQTADRQLFMWGYVDKDRYSVLLDTGWSYTTMVVGFSRAAGNSNRISELQLGKVRLTDVQTQIQSLGPGDKGSQRLILGADFLSKNNAILDFGAKTLYLRSKHTLEVTVIRIEERLKQAGWQEVELQLRAPAAWVCSTVIAGSTVNLLLDSGSPWSCLDQGSAKRLGIPTQPSVNLISGPRMQTTRIRVTSKLPIDFDGFQGAECRFAVFDMNELGFGGNGGLFPDVDGVLGATELIRNHAVLVCESNKIWFRK